jgi:hypothetical protein
MLPHTDAFLPAHNLHSLAELAALLARPAVPSRQLKAPAPRRAD